MGRAGYSTKQVVLKNTTQAVIASQTAQVVSETFAIRGDLARDFIVKILVNPATVGSGITGILQTTMAQTAAGVDIWEDSKTIAITTVATDTLFTIKLLDTVAGDQTYLPLAPRGRIAITTAAGATVSVLKIFVTDTSI